MNRFKVTHNHNILCVFAVVDTDIQVHLANIDTRTNRIYTTTDGYDLIATNAFKSNHKLQYFFEASMNTEYSEDKEFEKSDFRKFNAVIDFNPVELSNLITMCSREFAWG